MDEAAAHVTPLLDTALACDDDVHRDQHVAQLPAQSHRLQGGVLDLRLDHEEVQVAVHASIAPAVRPEQDHAGVGWRGLRQPSASLLDQRLVEHAPTVARPTKTKPLRAPRQARRRFEHNPTIDTLARLAQTLDLEFAIDIHPRQRTQKLLNGRARGKNAIASYETDTAAVFLVSGVVSSQVYVGLAAKFVVIHDDWRRLWLSVRRSF